MTHTDLLHGTPGRGGSTALASWFARTRAVRVCALLTLFALAGRCSAFVEGGEWVPEAAERGRLSAKLMLAQGRVADPGPDAAQAPPNSKRTQSARKPAAGAAQPSWREQLRSEIEACRGLSIFKRGFCMDKAKFKHCYPDRWDSVPECASTHAPQRDGSSY